MKVSRKEGLPDIAGSLRKLLERAEAGEIDSLVVVATSGDEGFVESLYADGDIDFLLDGIGQIGLTLISAARNRECDCAECVAERRLQ